MTRPNTILYIKHYFGGEVNKLIAFINTILKLALVLIKDIKAFAGYYLILF